MPRLVLFCLCLGALTGCPTTQDHGPRDDAGSDVRFTDAGLERDSGSDVTLDAGTDARPADDGGSPDTDAGGDVDAGRDLDAVRFVRIGSFLRPRVRTELVDGSFVTREWTQWRLSVSAATSDGNFETAPPTKTVGPCEYWPFTGASWPPGTYTPGELVTLDPEDVTVTVHGSAVAMERNGAMLLTSLNDVEGASIAVEVHLPSGTVRRTFRIGSPPRVDEPAIRAESDAYRGTYAPGEPLALRWPLQYGATDAEILVVGGDDAALWAQCTLDHADGALVFPWADVQADFIGSPGTSGNAVHVDKLTRREDVSVEGGVEVHLVQDRSLGFDLSPPAGL